VDHPDAIVVWVGVAILVGPAGVQVIFDYQGVSQVVGDLSGNPMPA